MQNTFSQSGNDSKWFLKKSIFQNRYVALETPSRPPLPLHGKNHLKFPFWLFDNLPYLDDENDCEVDGRNKWSRRSKFFVATSRSPQPLVTLRVMTMMISPLWWTNFFDKWWTIFDKWWTLFDKYYIQVLNLIVSTVGYSSHHN